MKADLFNQRGDKIEEIDLPDRIFSITPTPDLLHQVVLYYRNLSRRVIAKTKDRSEVRGGGRKPWRQKGTGRARHGSIRSPLWRKGGITFGPRTEKKYQTRISRAKRKKALSMVLSQKFKEGEIIFVEKIEDLGIKTKSFAKNFKNLTKIKKDILGKRALFVLTNKNENIIKAARNLKNVSLASINSLNPYLLLENKYLIIEKEAIEQFFKHNL